MLRDYRLSSLLVLLKAGKKEGVQVAALARVGSSNNETKNNS